MDGLIPVEDGPMKDAHAPMVPLGGGATSSSELGHVVPLLALGELLADLDDVVAHGGVHVGRRPLHMVEHVTHERTIARAHLIDHQWLALGLGGTSVLLE